MTGQELLDLYMGMKTHFNSKSYDFKKYHGKMKNSSRIGARSDRYFFEKVAGRLNNRNEAIAFLIANFLKDRSFWIGKENSFEIYESWQARNANLVKHLEDELYLLGETMYNKGIDFDQLVEVKNGQHPALLRLYLGDLISPETATMLLIGLKIDLAWSKTKLNADVLYSQEYLKLKKYACFFDFPTLLKKLEIPLTSLFKIPSKGESQSKEIVT